MTHDGYLLLFCLGTPSLCEPETIEKLINDVSGQCSVKDNLEISLEANPSSDDLQKLRWVDFIGNNEDWHGGWGALAHILVSHKPIPFVECLLALHLNASAPTCSTFSGSP